MNSIPREELDWLKQSIAQRITRKGELPEPPVLQPSSAYAVALHKFGAIKADRLLLILTLASQIDASLLASSISQNIANDGDHPEIGGVKSPNFRGLLPTAETFLFLVAGADVQKRLEAWQWLRSHSVLYQKGIVKILKPQAEGDPPQSGILSIDPDKAEEILFGESAPPAFSMEFPARKISTNLDWDDLVLASQTRQHVEELKDWLEKRQNIAAWGIGKRIKKGYRALFYGPPGTGKTLAASLLGKYTGTEVFLVDLSLVVSKYIGETEKNLSSLFDKAQNKNWILFFDEADALFGKRTSVRDAHDKYANQEVAYLLQRVEDFPGLVILASNLKGNIDEAFLRRFQSVIHFPLPGAQERFKIWKDAFTDVPGAPTDADLRMVAQKYELSGANIINAAHYACLRAAATGKKPELEFVLTGIQRELQKEGKVG
jgi:SpoVK/Ycf46/Vps4 family AAA+-type ATPase